MHKTETFDDSPQNPKPKVYFTTPELWRKFASLAKQMRHEPTLAENKLWQVIRNRKIKEVKI